MLEQIKEKDFVHNDYKVSVEDEKNSLRDIRLFLDNFKDLIESAKLAKKEAKKATEETVIEEKKENIENPVVEKLAENKEEKSETTEAKKVATSDNSGWVSYNVEQAKTERTIKKPFQKDNTSSTYKRDAKPYNTTSKSEQLAHNAPVEVVPSKFISKITKKKETSDKDFQDKKENKKALIKKGYIANVRNDNFYDELDEDFDRKVKIKKKKNEVKKKEVKEQVTLTHDSISLRDFSSKLGQTVDDIIRAYLSIDKTLTKHDLDGDYVINFEQAQEIAFNLGTILELKIQMSKEAKIREIIENMPEDNFQLRAPVVTIMGHVDHGKTSLLDYIRKSHVAAGEAGGITQHIGAYTIEVNKKKITFLDTPGHEAFTTMRKRGAMVTDIAIVVVACDDGIMPQTREAISHAKEAGVQIIIAVNKIDKVAKVDLNPIYVAMGELGLLPEEWGGDIIVVPVSAKTGQNVDKLLDTINLIAEVSEFKAPLDCPALASIIEAKLDKGTGPVANILVKKGTLKVGDFIAAGCTSGKVRAMLDDKGKQVKLAGPSDAVSVLGLSDVPDAGDELISCPDDKTAREVANERLMARKEKDELSKEPLSIFDQLKLNSQNLKELKVIVKGDVHGSVEAVRQALDKLRTTSSDGEEVAVKVIHQAVGAINESDVILAETAGAIIVGFNVRPDSKAKALAEKSNVIIELYRIIYEMIENLELKVKGMFSPKFEEEIQGQIEVRNIFNLSVGVIAGSHVVSGYITRNSKIRVIRNDTIVGDVEVASLKREKDNVSEVKAGFDCGIQLSSTKNFLSSEVLVGDILEAYVIKEVKNV